MRLTRPTLICAIIASLTLAGFAQQPARAGPAIHDCASFQAWFKQQPGFQLTVDAHRYDAGAPRPRAGSDSLDLAVSTMTYYRGNVGGGGCVGAFYDQQRQAAAVIDQYDTAADLEETVVVVPPVGIKAGTVAARTHNGVALGMMQRQVEAIEGKGRLRSSGRDVVLSYAWSKPNGKDFAMSFLLRAGRVIAMDYFSGF